MSKKNNTSKIKKNNNGKSNIRKSSSNLNSNKKIDRGYVDTTSTTSELKKLLIIIISILLIFVLCYFIISVALDHKKDSTASESNNSSEEATIQYDKILLSQLLNRDLEEYYVFASKSNDDNLSDYENSIYSYTSSEESVKVYDVDLDSSFNKKYISDNSNYDIDSIEDLRVKGTTLFYIKDNKIEDVYDGKELINSKLEELVESVSDNK